MKFNYNNINIYYYYVYILAKPQPIELEFPLPITNETLLNHNITKSRNVSWILLYYIYNLC